MQWWSFFFIWLIRAISCQPQVTWRCIKIPLPMKCNVKLMEKNRAHDETSEQMSQRIEQWSLAVYTYLNLINLILKARTARELWLVFRSLWFTGNLHELGCFHFTPFYCLSCILSWCSYPNQVLCCVGFFRLLVLYTII